MEKPYWEGKHYAFFSNKECEYFPCHAGADPENFNCLFCYCPLYALGDKCGGNFRMTETGIKDCTNCQLPHKAQNYGYVTGKYSELAELMKKIREEKDGLLYRHTSDILEHASFSGCSRALISDCSA